MALDSGKKIIILYILSILRKYTDANHPMTQQQIAEKLLSDYGMEVNRSTIKRNIEDLIDAEYDIGYTEIKRTHTDKKTGEKEENYIYTDLYYEHEFSESELHMLIDGLLFSRSVPYTARKDLIEKLGDLSSSYFSRRMNHVRCMSSDSPENKSLFYNIELLDEAIAEGKQVRITYGYYGMDMKLHENMNEDGSRKWQILNPYQMVASEGRYYLICNKDNYPNVANYRIDRIVSIEVLEKPAKPKNQVEGLEDGLNMEDYVYQNLNMFTGKPEKVEFVVPRRAVSVVIDFFGRHVKFHEEDGTVECSLLVSRESMKRWAVQMAGTVRVISPPELVEEIREEIRQFARQYELKEI